MSTRIFHRLTAHFPGDTVALEMIVGNLNECFWKNRAMLPGKRFVAQRRDRDRFQRRRSENQSPRSARFYLHSFGRYPHLYVVWFDIFGSNRPTAKHCMRADLNSG